MTRRWDPFSQDTSLQTSLHYLVAFSSVVFALFVETVIPAGINQCGFFLYYPAIVLSTLLGGFGPGLLSLGLSTIFIEYFQLWPQFALQSEVSANGIRLTLFSLLGFLLVLLVSRQRRIERDLRYSEARAKGLLQSDRVGLVISDNAGNYLEVNDAFLNIIGYSRDDYEHGRIDWRSLTPAEFVDLDEQSSWELILNGHTKPYEKQYIRKDGSKVPVLVGRSLIGTKKDCFSSYILDLSKQKEVEAALIAQKEQLTIVTNAMPGVICYLDRDLRLVFLSKTFERWWGVNTADVIGQPASKIIGEEPFSPSGPFLQRALQGESVTFESVLQGKRYVQVQYVPDVLEDGSVRGVFALMTDLTERRQAEMALQESQERLELALAGANMGTWDWEIETGDLLLDETGHALLGFKPGEFHGTSDEFYRIVLPEDLERMTKQVSEAVENHAPWHCQYRVQWPDGSIHWLHGSGRAVYDSNGTPIRMVGTFSEITHEKQSEARILRSEQRYRSLVQAMSAVVWTMDSEGNFAKPQASWEAYTGQPWSLHQGLGWAEMIHPYDREALSDTFFEALKLGKSYEVDGRIWHARSKAYRQFVCRGVPVIREDGSIREWVGMVDDVEDRKQSEQVLELLTEELRQAVRVRDDFLSIASHELKTPLTSIRLQLQILNRKAERQQDGLISAPMIIEKLKATERQVERLDALVNDLLDVSRIGNQKFSVVFKEFDLVAVAQDVIERFEEQSLQMKTQIQLHAAAPILGYWDAGRIDQVLTNLISNATKYGNGKPIDVNICAVDNDEVEIIVKDQGIGIPKEAQERVFERFERVTESSVGGLGLGLYIVRQIVELHGGSIRLESEEGSGSVFIVRLPRRAPASNSEKPAPPEERAVSY